MRSALFAAPLAALALACSSTPTTPSVDAGVTAPSTWNAHPNCREPLDSSKVILPRDDGQHADDIEWWYWTGHLKAADGRWFGVEEVFFRAKQMNARGVMAHSALTDIAGKRFFHRSNLVLGDLTAAPASFDYELATQTVKGGAGHDVLHGEGDGYAFDLVLDEAKRPTLQHGTGYTDYVFGGYTYYYSRERMSAAGTITIGDETVPVTGSAWFDHQYGDLGSAVNKGWDWFALQLDDNREIMIFVVRDAQTPVVVGASYTDATCTTTALEPADFEIVPQRSWKSAKTGCIYPLDWVVRVKGETFVVTSVLDEQELWKSTPIYWEGAATVTGASTGRAYVELNGYCPASSSN